MFRTFLILDTGSIHPEAQNWAARVAANGGTVSDSTLKAVSDFCKETASIRSLFLRLNLFCGNNLNAALVPLFLGEAPGIVYGNTVDTNVNFVADDYTERGTNGGLIGNGVNKYLDTGFIPNSVAAYGRQNASMSIYLKNNIQEDRNQIGVGQSGIFNNLRVRNTSDLLGSRINSNTTTGTISNLNSSGFLISIRNNSSDVLIYKNSGLFGSISAPVSGSKNTFSIFVFCTNNSGTPLNYSQNRISEYSVSRSLTAAQVSVFYAALQKFQTALNRQV